VTPSAIDASALSTRQLNCELRDALARHSEAVVVGPAARHNIAVALLSPGRVEIEGSVGYYCAGMNDGATVEIHGSAGWGLAEGMLSGLVVVSGNAGNGAAASIRGGMVVVHGDCAARAGVAMKGGSLLIGGSVGYMTGFMMQRGMIVISGDADEALADSMYEGVIFVGGEIASLGNDAVTEHPTSEEAAMLSAILAEFGLPQPKRGCFRKIVSGRKLWNFEKHEIATWREAL
jgi:glutamate synthase domain-containing protein 3